jgi:hypothetical protein
MRPLEASTCALLTLGKHMPRQRHQNGSVEKTKTKPSRWNGPYAIYVIEGGEEKRKSRETILGLVSEMTKADAEEKLRKIIRQENGAASSGAMMLWEFMHDPPPATLLCAAPAGRRLEGNS